MKTCSNKLAAFFTLAFILAIIPCAWSAGANNMMGGIGNGGGMMGGGSGMGQFKAADLNGDGVPEISYIEAGSYLVILDNMGMVKSTELLPVIPGQTTQLKVSASGIDVADLDGDKVPEIITEYRGYNGAYLVILDNQGNYKSSQKLPTLLY
jgi:hypothetical protein